MNKLGTPTAERRLAQITVDKLIQEGFLDSKTLDFIGAIDILETKYKLMIETKEMVLDLFTD
jgi:hypothetical protein